MAKSLTASLSFIVATRLDVFALIIYFSVRGETMRSTWPRKDDRLPSTKHIVRMAMSIRVRTPNGIDRVPVAARFAAVAVVPMTAGIGAVAS